MIVEKSTLTFLKNLKENNNKQWLEANRTSFEAAKNNFETFTGEMIAGISKFDKNIAGLVPKNCTFRQYRDIRFSKDKTPYKIHMGAYFNLGGKKINTPGYYFHLEPGGKSLIAGGLYVPEKEPLAKTRQEIDYNFEEWSKILSNSNFKKHFPKGIEKTDTLQRPPKGYDENNPAIEYLKLKSFTTGKYLSDEEILHPDFNKSCINFFKALVPLIGFLNRAVE